MTVDIIIPNYNGARLIAQNLPKVIDSIQGYNGKIIIVDDGSVIAEKVLLREIIASFIKNNKRVELVEHLKNKGFSSAVNTGVRNSTADYVVLLNSDVIPSKDFLKSPIEHLLSDDMLFAVGCLDESIEEGHIIKRGRGLGYWKQGMLNHSKGEIINSDTFWVSGGSSLFVRALYVKLGGMDTLYNPFYWEDIDLSYRAQKAGYHLLFDRNAVVTHMHEKGAVMGNFKKNTVTTIAYRNQFIFIWKNITNSNLLLNHIFYLPLNILFALKRKDLNFFKGLFLAVIKLPAIINRRQKQRKLFKFSDIEIIKRFS